MATEQVGFTVGEEMAIQSGNPEFVASIKEFVRKNQHDFLTLPPQKDGSIVYARKDSIPFFMFRTVSDIIGTNGQKLALMKDEPSNDRTDTDEGQSNSSEQPGSSIISSETP